MRAPGHPQGSFNTEIIMDELADQVNMDPIEFRIKNLPPEAPNAMWRTYLREGAAEFGWNKRHATGDKTPGPDQDRHGRFDQHVGRRRPRTLAGALRNHVGWRRRHAPRHAGSRHGHAHAGRRHHGRCAGTAPVAGQAGDRRHGLWRERLVGRQHDGGEHQSGNPRRRDQGARCVEGEGRAGAGRGCRIAGRRGRPHSGRERSLERNDVGRRL